ncbi:dihydroxyacetone kinase phosphoryl donor subunit DhaM [Camelliibacillus cellulosilyticus]|uniref:phosphoenolpyruvate--glycerone phosphotransferase n=1 Tax=Camelliibacillus cellulosilyticus TaxID=2174486 RepID=A0ABV9GK91_9BACL
MSVGIVIISHSADITKGLQALIKQAIPDVKLAIAGGTDDNDIGTSAMKIMAQIETVHSEDGVVVLYDLGSAKMNAELAIEMLGSPDNVVIAAAPLVEGAYIAAVEAGLEKSLQEVKEAAEKAYL